MRIGRRSALTLLGSSALAGSIPGARATEKSVTIGINMPLTTALAPKTQPTFCTARYSRSRRRMPPAGQAATRSKHWCWTTAPRPRGAI